MPNYIYDAAIAHQSRQFGPALFFTYNSHHGINCSRGVQWIGKKLACQRLFSEIKAMVKPQPGNDQLRGHLASVVVSNKSRTIILLTMHDHKGRELARKLVPDMDLFIDRKSLQAAQLDESLCFFVEQDVGESILDLLLASEC